MLFVYFPLYYCSPRIVAFPASKSCMFHSRYMLSREVRCSYDQNYECQSRVITRHKLFVNCRNGIWTARSFNLSKSASQYPNLWEIVFPSDRTPPRVARNVAPKGSISKHWYRILLKCSSKVKSLLPFREWEERGILRYWKLWWARSRQKTFKR